MSLVPSNNVVVCYGGSVTLRCTTTEGALLWRTSNSENRLFNNINQPTTLLGNFTLNVVSVISNGTSLSVTSTASLVNFQFTSSGLQLKIECEEVTVLNPSEEAFLIAAGKRGSLDTLCNLYHMHVKCVKGGWSEVGGSDVGLFSFLLVFVVVEIKGYLPSNLVVNYINQSLYMQLPWWCLVYIMLQSSAIKKSNINFIAGLLS